MSRFTAKPISAVLSLAALFLAVPLAAQLTFNDPGPQVGNRGFGKNKVQYRDFDWQIYHATHFDVHYYSAEEKLLERVVSFAESAYDRLSRDFDFQIQDPIPLIFYDTHTAFEQNNIILNFIPEGTGAFASPVRFRMVLPTDLPEPELMALILHELTHIFQYHILFGGNVARALTATPPLWVMEGMASYMAKDESARDLSYLRDAAVNDLIPPVTRWRGSGFFAYRIGHAVFEFMEERWGKDGFNDFVYEYRNTLGGGVGRAVERTFRIDPDDFDFEFRLWLRRKYLQKLLETGEPAEFGRPFRADPVRQSQETSGAASPSGDLIAAFSIVAGDLDIILLDAKNRRFVRNLTKGFSNEYQYLVAQELSLGRKMGRDLDFSPDGNTIAVFGRREGGRSMFFIDVLKGGIRKRIDLPGIDQQLSPAFSPDGRRIAFSGYKDGQFDIFIYDLDSGEVTNVTNDAVFDGAPVFTPDGQGLVFSSVIGDGYAKLFRLDLSNPAERYQLTTGETNDTDAVFSTSGNRIYYTSDAGDIDNVYGMDLNTGEVLQYTNAVTGCFQPTVLRQIEGEERLVYSALWKGRFQLYATDIEEPVKEPVTVEIPDQPIQPGEIHYYEPDIQVTVTDDNKEKYGGFRLFVEGADSFLGIDDDQTFIGQAVISFSDYLGDRRLLAAFASVDSFSNFDVVYRDLSRRWQWGFHVFDDRDFFIGRDQRTGRLERGQAASKITGAVGTIIFPFSFYQRVELSAGYAFRDLDFQAFVVDQNSGQQIPIIEPREDDFPLIQAALVGDSTVFAPWGPISGRRWRLDAFYAPNLDDSGTLQSRIDIDFRQYVPLSRRTTLAWRLFAGVAGGDFPSPFYFGGLDTIRSFDFREIVGTEAFFTNLELRFPLIDVLQTPVFGFQGVRGVLFLDVGGAYFDKFEDFRFYNSDENRLEDAVAAYGWGVTFRLFGLDWNWDFAKQWDFKDSSDFRTSFWIGSRF